jgi:hypothetical protein
MKLGKSEEYKIIVTEEILSSNKGNLLLDRVNNRKIRKISFNLKCTEKLTLISTLHNLELRKEILPTTYLRNSRKICTIQNLGLNYELNFNNEITSLSNNYWIDISKTYQNELIKYKLFNNDIFKIGSKIFKILEMKTLSLNNKKLSLITFENKNKNARATTLGNKITFISKNSNNLLIDTDNNNNNSSIHEKLSLNSSSFIKLNLDNNKLNKLPLKTYIDCQKICRICLGTLIEKENPFISPCLCKGTMEYVHLNCLKKNIKSKLIKFDNFNDLIRIYYFSNFSCELCGMIYPKSFYLNDKKISFQIFDFNLPLTNFIFMESTSNNKKYEIAFYIFDFNKSEKISIGKENVDLILDDNLINYYHCDIYLNKGSFYINDNNFDGGTLVNIGRNNKIYLSYSQPLFIVYKSFLYSFNLKLSFCNIFFSCLSCKKQMPIKKLNYNSIFHIYGKSNDNNCNKENEMFHIDQIENKIIPFRGKENKLSVTINPKFIKNLGI